MARKRPGSKRPPHVPRPELGHLLHVAGSLPRKLRFGRVVDVLTGGNHHPLVGELEDEAGPAGTWVVKPQVLLSAQDARGALLVLAELAASELCAWAGVSTPAIGLVRFPRDPDLESIAQGLLHLDPELRREVLELHKLNRDALAFCGRLLEQAVDVRPHTFGTRARRAEVAEVGSAIFFLDAYMRNDDRQIENPNVLWFFDRLIAIDHGHAFARLSAPGGTGAALAARTVLHSHIGFERHALRAPLQKLGDALLRLHRIGAAVQQVSDRDIERLLTIWPAELDASRLGGPSGMRDELVAFLMHRRTHAHEIAMNLARFLEEP